MNLCNICKRSFPKDSALQVHVLMVHKDKDNSHYYNVQKPDLKVSKTKVYLDLKDHFKCKHCNYGTTKKDNMMSHIKVIHGVTDDGKSSEREEIGKDSSGESDASQNVNLPLPETVIDAIAEDMSSETEREEMSTISTSSPSTLPNSQNVGKNCGQTWWPPIETGVRQTQDLGVETREIQEGRESRCRVNHYENLGEITYGSDSIDKQVQDVSAMEEEEEDDPTEYGEMKEEVQNDHWPMDCNKCGLSLDTLEDFNQHMNDHWSDNKYCPICDLLINSKRNNFRQHLMIHTGERPFVCKFCDRGAIQSKQFLARVLA